MAMQDQITPPLDSITKLVTALMGQGSSLPGFTVAKLSSIIGETTSPVDKIVQSMEALYAGLKVSTVFPDELAHVLGNLAHQVATYMWHGKADRAMGIYGACLRWVSEGSQPVENDPVVDENFQEPVLPPPTV